MASDGVISLSLRSSLTLCSISSGAQLSRGTWQRPQHNSGPCPHVTIAGWPWKEWANLIPKHLAPTVTQGVKGRWEPVSALQKHLLWNGCESNPGYRVKVSGRGWQATVPESNPLAACSYTTKELRMAFTRILWDAWNNVEFKSPDP
jgi:hypothetical protein